MYIILLFIICTLYAIYVVSYYDADSVENVNHQRKYIILQMSIYHIYQAV